MVQIWSCYSQKLGATNPSNSTEWRGSTRQAQRNLVWKITRQQLFWEIECGVFKKRGRDREAGLDLGEEDREGAVLPLDVAHLLRLPSGKYSNRIRKSHVWDLPLTEFKGYRPTRNVLS